MASLAMKMVVMIMINMVVVGVINYKSTQFRLLLICALHHQKSDLQYFGNKKLSISLYFSNGVGLWGGRGDMVGWVYVFVCELFWISQQMFL